MLMFVSWGGGDEEVLRWPQSLCVSSAPQGLCTQELPGRMPGRGARTRSSGHELSTTSSPPHGEQKLSREGGRAWSPAQGGCGGASNSAAPGGSPALTVVEFPLNLSCLGSQCLCAWLGCQVTLTAAEP